MKKLVTALIVDDELASRDLLTDLLNAHFPEIEIVASLGKPKEVLSFLTQQKPDIIFLDVQMVLNCSTLFLIYKVKLYLLVLFKSLHCGHFDTMQSIFY